MELLYITIAILIIIAAALILKNLSIKNNYKIETETNKKLNKNIYEKEQELENIKKEIDLIKKENQIIKECDDKILNEKDIVKVFEFLEENNHPRATKDKMTRLWEILPYYPPDWKLRKYVVRKRDNYCCKKCGKQLDGYTPGEYGEVHHIIPLSMNGTNEIRNLVYVCHNCHVKLHDDLYNFDFAKYNYTPLYGISYEKLFAKQDIKSYKKSMFKINELSKQQGYEPVEPNPDPDTDLFYNISHWEDKIK